jgi:RNA polymerase sigma-70 factor (ECF subfamily)
MDLKEEKALLARCRKDPQAFGEVFDAHFDGIFRFALHRLADVSAAEEVASQTFFKALRSLHKFRPGRAPISAWIYRIALNEAATLERKGRGIRRIHGDIEGGREVAAPGPSPEMEALAAEEAPARERDFLALHEAMKALKPKERTLIVLRYFEKKSFGEIAAICRTREGTLRMRNQRALEKLRTLLQSKGLSHDGHGRGTVSDEDAAGAGRRIPPEAAARSYGGP